MVYEIALKLVKGVGDIAVRNLIQVCGSAEEVFKTKLSNLIKIPGIGEKIASEIIKNTTFGQAEKECLFIEKYKISTLFYTDDTYPKRLLFCDDAPTLLYYKGNANLNNPKVIAVVGTRNATNYGKQFCQKLISGLKKQDVLIASGLAYGIDVAAHKAAIAENMPTVGILGHGLDRIYPALHRDIAEKMLHEGGLLTEFPSQTNPDRQNFPKRNRIIAGIADATIVVEATLKGGALITAEIANSYNRDVFALPGNIENEFSEGCNYLIKTNRAQLITKVEDIEYMLNWVKTEVKAPSQQLKIFATLAKDEQQVVKYISDNNTVTFDDLQLNISMPQSKLSMTILNLEMQGIVIAFPGKVYKLNT